MVGDRERARDAVQEAFARAIRGRFSFRGEGSVEAWLWRTLANVCAEERRSLVRVASRAAAPAGKGEEHELRGREQVDSSDPAALEEETERLRVVEVELDRCWDLLRQRRALRDAGSDPEQAQVRDADTVERYQQ